MNSMWTFHVFWNGLFICKALTFPSNTHFACYAEQTPTTPPCVLKGMPHNHAVCRGSMLLTSVVYKACAFNSTRTRLTMYFVHNACCDTAIPKMIHTTHTEHKLHWCRACIGTILVTNEFWWVFLARVQKMRSSLWFCFSITEPTLYVELCQ